MTGINIKELRAIKKIKQLHQKQIAELRKLNTKHQVALLALSHKLGITLTKSFKKELYRKCIHLSSLWIPALIYFAPQTTDTILFGILALGDIIIEYGNYKKWKWARFLFGRLFSKTLRPKESNRTQFELSGSVYVLLAAIGCTMIFDEYIAMIAMTVMLIADTCAALFGKAFGTRMLRKNKSMEGSAALLVSTLLIMVLYNPLYTVTYASIIAAFATVGVEMFEDKLKLDDNFSIPLTVGIILSLLN